LNDDQLVYSSDAFYSLKGNNMAFSNALLSAKREKFTPKDFSKIVHHPPVSIGLSIRKELTHTVSIESGLNYTYLYSEFENKIPQQDAKLELHYLGIPVNLVVNLFGAHYAKWNMYVSAGGMVEKGLFSHYVQNEYMNNTSISTTFNEQPIDGLQWSVQAALGIDYKISRNYRIYFEPKVSYYLDNNQPFSSRTEHPFVPGLNAGIRYSW
jgi:hypothetical protein